MYTAWSLAGAIVSCFVTVAVFLGNAVFLSNALPDRRAARNWLPDCRAAWHPSHLGAPDADGWRPLTGCPP